MASARARLTQGELIVLAGGTLLLIDLLFLPWHRIELGPLVATVSAVEDPYRAYGIAAAVLTALMIVQIVATMVLSRRLPQLPLPWGQIQLIAGVFVAVLLIIKLVRLDESLGYGAYSAILGGVLVAYGGYLIAREPAAPGR